MRANTISRGGGGVRFEHRVGADMLNRLLTRSGLDALDDAFEVAEVAFQTGDPVDDLRVRARHPDIGSRTLFVAARRKPGLRPSDKKFVALVASMLHQIDLTPDAFATREARLGLAVRADTQAVESMVNLCGIARDHDGGDELARAVCSPRAHSPAIRNRYAKLLDVVGLARPGASQSQLQSWLWQFLFACHVMPLRLEGGNATDRTAAIERLGLVGLETRDASETQAVMETLASGYGNDGAVVDMTRLRRDLQPLARVGRSTRNSVGWQIIERLDTSAALTVPRLSRPDGTSVTVERSELRQKLREAIAACGASAQLLVVTGEPSTGKSALALSVAGALADEGEAIVRLDLGDLPGGDAGLDSGFAALLSALEETPVAPCRAVLIDGCEAVAQGRSRTLRVLVSAAQRAGLGVVVVVRDDLLPDVLDLASVPDCDQIEVGLLSDDEIDHIASEIPALLPATRSGRSRRVVGRIGLASLLVQSLGPQMADAALSEAMVMRTVWDGLIRRRDFARTGASPDDRSSATEAAARHLLGLAAGSNPSGHALESLRLDGVLGRPPAQTPWLDEPRFADDAIRDFAVAIVLLKESLQPLLRAAPKWAIRSARIATQARLEEATDVATELDVLQRFFDTVADTSGIRWSEIPTEALLTMKAPEASLQAASAWLVDGQIRIQRLLRVLRQRHGGPFETLDPAVATPVLTLLADSAAALPDYGEVADDCTRALMAWLRGLALRETDDSCEARRRYTKLLLAKDRYDEKTLEAISMLGPDLGEGVPFLESVADTSPWQLHDVVESTLAPYSLARSHPDLLIRLAEAYYIEQPDKRRGYSGLVDNGIRDIRHGSGFGHPFAAPYFGPFWRMLNSKPADALLAIERILLHTLRITSGPDAPEGIAVDLPGLGRRVFVGDLRSWGWYRGLPMGLGPHPCMSALMAIESFAGHIASLGVPPSQVLGIILREATTVPTLALAVGFAVRHADACDEFVLAFLREPVIWDAETARVAGETLGYKAGPRDDDQVVNADRRTWDFRELGSRLVADAILEDDQERIEQLRDVADSYVGQARPLGPRAEEQARLWSTVLVGDNYTKVSFGDQQALTYEPPDWALRNIAEQMKPIQRMNQVYELAARYREATCDPSALPADIQVARDIVADPPDAHRPGDAVASVALAAVRTHAHGSARIKKVDLRWAFDVLRDTASASHDDDDTFYPLGADRSAATAIGQLLMPAFHESSPTQPILQIGELATFGTQLAATGSDEVRRLLGLGLADVWSAPCGPGQASSDTCRHAVALKLAEQTARRCRIGPFDPSLGRSRLVDVALPLSTELDQIPTRDVMLDRLTGAIAASSACALSKCCISERAMPLAQALVRTHRRVAGHWADSNFEYREWNSEPVASALLDLSANGDDALLETALHLADHPHGLAMLLDDICRLATYDRAHRASMSACWPTLFGRVTVKLQETGEREGKAADEWRHWGDYALAALVPVPQFNLDEMDYDSTLAAARVDWPGLNAISDSIDAWIQLAAGVPKCIDALARLVRQESDPTRGLTFIERLIHGHTSWVANRTGSLHHWLGDLAGSELSDSATATLDRIIDSLASAGDDHIARLQEE